MTTDQHAAGDEWWRRAPLYLVVIGAMAVSIGGQVATLEDRIGQGWAILLALTNDVGAIIALDAAFSRFSNKTIRTWAWFAILLAGGTGAALNTWHTIHGDDKEALKDLPIFYGWLIGIEQILLVLILTHLVGLLTAARRHPHGATASGTPAAGDRTVGDEVADRQRGTASSATVRQPMTATPAGDGQPLTANPAGDRQHATNPTTSAPPARDHQSASRPPALSAGDRQGPLVMTASDASGGALVVTAGTAPSPASLPARAPKSTGKPAPRTADSDAVKARRSTPRMDYMTDLLLHQVAKKIAAARAENDTYGRDQVVADFRLTGHKARMVLAYIDERDLARQEEAS